MSYSKLYLSRMAYFKSFKLKKLMRFKTDAFYSTNVYLQDDLPHVDPENGLNNLLSHDDYFKTSKLFTMKDLFDARVHLGHREGTLNVNMKPYLFGSRLGHLIIDLDQTADAMRLALNFTAHIAYRDGIILFIGQNPQAAFMIEETAQKVGEFAHTRHWRRGMLTNSTVMFGAMTRLPDLIIILNTLTNVFNEHTAIAEAAKMAIPSIGIVDTNCNPNLITYPVPGNDDSIPSIALYCKLFSQAIKLGKDARKAATAS